MVVTWWIVAFLRNVSPPQSPCCSCHLSSMFVMTLLQIYGFATGHNVDLEGPCQVVKYPHPSVLGLSTLPSLFVMTLLFVSGSIPMSPVPCGVFCRLTWAGRCRTLKDNHLMHSKCQISHIPLRDLPYQVSTSPLLLWHSPLFTVHLVSVIPHLANVWSMTSKCFRGMAGI